MTDLETRVATKLREALDVCIDDGDGAIDTKGLAQVVIAAVREWDKEQAYEGSEGIPVTAHPIEHVGKVATMTQSELKPCPFVHDVVRGVSVEVDDEEWDCACVRCEDCTAMGPVMMLNDYSDQPSAEQAAITAWNDRVGEHHGHR